MKALDGREVFIILYALGGGGKTVAVADQCAAFLELGVNPSVVTFNLEKDSQATEASAVRSGRLPHGTRVVNMHAEIVQDQTEASVADWSAEADRNDSGLTCAEHTVDAQIHSTYFDQYGRTVKLRQTKHGTPVRTTYFSNSVPHLIREYDARGICNREMSVVGSRSDVAEERYFTPDGFCYATRRLDPATGNQRGVFWHDRHSGATRRFGHNTPWHAAWLEKFLRSRENIRGLPFVIGESASAVLKVLDIEPGVGKRLYMFHENHLEAPYTFGSKVRADYGVAPRRLDEMAALVVPTEAQAADIRAQFGDGVKVRAIGNRVVDKRTRSDVDKVPGLVGYFGRLAPSKRLDSALRVFRDALLQHPDAKFEIFGDGPDRKKLEELAEELGIAASVTFHGRIANVGDEMARCAVTISTSDTEAFGLSIAESLAAGTAVVSYAINYGPRDLIRDGIDGRLISPGDEEKFADALIDLLAHPDRAERMGAEGAARMASVFSRETFLREWEEVLLSADALE